MKASCSAGQRTRSEAERSRATRSGGCASRRTWPTKPERRAARDAMRGSKHPNLVLWPSDPMRRASRRQARIKRCQAVFWVRPYPVCQPAGLQPALLGVGCNDMTRVGRHERYPRPGFLFLPAANPHLICCVLTCQRRADRAPSRAPPGRGRAVWANQRKRPERFRPDRTARVGPVSATYLQEGGIGRAKPRRRQYYADGDACSCVACCCSCLESLCVLPRSPAGLHLHAAGTSRQVPPTYRKHTRRRQACSCLSVGSWGRVQPRLAAARDGATERWSGEQTAKSPGQETARHPGRREMRH